MDELHSNLENLKTCVQKAIENSYHQALISIINFLNKYPTASSMPEVKLTYLCRQRLGQNAQASHLKTVSVPFFIEETKNHNHEPKIKISVEIEEEVFFFTQCVFILPSGQPLTFTKKDDSHWIETKGSLTSKIRSTSPPPIERECRFDETKTTKKTNFSSNEDVLKNTKKGMNDSEPGRIKSPSRSIRSFIQSSKIGSFFPNISNRPDGEITIRRNEPPKL